MKLLLDTQSLLWWINDNPKLGTLARDVIADSSNEILVSVASFWEISVKHRIGKLEDSGSAVMREAETGGFSVIRIEAEHLASLEALVAKPGHKDPFDHLILIHAMACDAILITSDAHLRSYGVKCIG